MIFNRPALMKVLENVLFISIMLLIVIGGGCAVFKFAFDMGKRSGVATQLNDDYILTVTADTVTYMGITASTTMSIHKVRQSYDALGQNLNPDALLKSIGSKDTLSPHLPSAIMFFTHKSCQICVGEMVELLYSLSDNCNRLNVIGICFSPDRLAALAYRPTNFSNFIYVVDTTSSSLLAPKWFYIKPHKPVVFIVDTSASVITSYFFQEKDMDTRQCFSEAVTRILQKNAYQSN